MRESKVVTCGRQRSQPGWHEVVMISLAKNCSLGLLLATLFACGPAEFRSRSASDEGSSENEAFQRSVTISDEDDEDFEMNDEADEEWYSNEEESAED